MGASRRETGGGGADELSKGNEPLLVGPDWGPGARSETPWRRRDL